jgi:hypothetical protein
MRRSSKDERPSLLRDAIQTRIKELLAAGPATKAMIERVILQVVHEMTTPHVDVIQDPTDASKVILWVRRSALPAMRN